MSSRWTILILQSLLPLNFLISDMEGKCVHPGTNLRKYLTRAQMSVSREIQEVEMLTSIVSKYNCHILQIRDKKKDLKMSICISRFS